MRTKLGTSLLIVALAATLAACGGSAAGTPAASAAANPTDAPAATDDAGGAAEATPAATQGGSGAMDVCSMLSAADVKAIVGKDMTAGQQEGASLPDWAVAQCWWDTADMSIRFSVDVGTKDSIAKSTSPTAKEQLEISKMAFGAFGKVEDVALGDGAVWSGGFVLAIKGDSMMQLYGLNLDKATAVALAKLIVDKL